jgi:hypothetical protein
LKGDGMALAGLITGYVGLAFVPFVLIIASITIPSLLRSRQVANEAAAVANLRSIHSAEEQFKASGTRYGDLRELITAGYLDDSFLRDKSGYTFSVTVLLTEYTATALPASTNTGRYGYFIDPNGVVRYSETATLAPPGQNGLPVN